MAFAGSNTESVAAGKDFPALFNSVVVLRAAVLLSKSACMVVLRIVGASTVLVGLHFFVVTLIAKLVENAKQLLNLGLSIPKK